MSTVTLTEFLLARIAEDEARAKAAIGSLKEEDRERRWSEDTEMWVYGYEFYLDGDVSDFVEANDPHRVLAECEAKRRVIEEIWTYEDRIEGEWGSCRSVSELQADPIQPDALKALALPDSDHPDYRDEWRPEG